MKARLARSPSVGEPVQLAGGGDLAGLAELDRAPVAELRRAGAGRTGRPRSAGRGRPRSRRRAAAPCRSRRGRDGPGRGWRPPGRTRRPGWCWGRRTARSGRAWERSAPKAAGSSVPFVVPGRMAGTWRETIGTPAGFRQVRAARLGVGQRHAGPRDLPRRHPPGLASGPRRPGRPDGGLGQRRRWTPGLLDLPLPGRGATAERLAGLADLGTVDLDLARLAEAHTDAAAIRADLGFDGPDDGLWGVWAANPPADPLLARPDGRPGGVLAGTKPWCSGAGCCDRALVTARTDDGYRLFAVDLGDARRDAGGRHLAGRRDARAATAGRCASTALPAEPVGGPEEYLQPAGLLARRGRRGRRLVGRCPRRRPRAGPGRRPPAAEPARPRPRRAPSTPRSRPPGPASPRRPPSSTTTPTTRPGSPGSRPAGSGPSSRPPRPRSSTAPAGRSGPRRSPWTPTTAGGSPTSGCTSGRATPSATSRSLGRASLDAGGFPWTTPDGPA